MFSLWSLKAAENFRSWGVEKAETTIQGLFLINILQVEKKHLKGYAERQLWHYVWKKGFKSEKFYRISKVKSFILFQKWKSSILKQ